MTFFGLLKIFALCVYLATELTVVDLCVNMQIVPSDVFVTLADNQSGQSICITRQNDSMGNKFFPSRPTILNYTRPYSTKTFVVYGLRIAVSLILVSHH